MTHEREDAAMRALDELRTQLDRTIDELRAAGERLDELARLRIAGRSWLEIVSNEDRPLVVETVSRALDDLGAVGGQFRRAEARALIEEQVSMNKVGNLFGVSRQRISALVRDREDQASPG